MSLSTFNDTKNSYMLFPSVCNRSTIKSLTHQPSKESEKKGLTIKPTKTEYTVFTKRNSSRCEIHTRDVKDQTSTEIYISGNCFNEGEKIQH